MILWKVNLLMVGEKDFLINIEQQKMEQNIISLLGGRAAEELMIKDITTGASNDIERATAIARDMVMRYGIQTFTTIISKMKI